MSVFTNHADSRSAEQARAYAAAVLDLLGAKDPMDVLESTPAAVSRTLAGLSETQVTTPEARGKWSIRHVVQHLADSELIWGYRLRTVLAHDRPQLAGYDQDRLAERLRYDQAHAVQALRDFAALRNLNVRVLRSTPVEDLKRVSVHPYRGEETIEYMVRLYAGHDLLHLHQIDRIRGSVTRGDPSAASAPAPFTVRSVRPDDFAQWLRLWDGYNAFYGRHGVTALPRAITELTWQRFLDPGEPVHALVVEQNDALIGLAHYLFHRSTTMAGLTCYLQDLFVSEAARSRGVGRALIHAVYERARGAGSERVYWQTQESNRDAMALYDKVAERSGFIVYRASLSR